MDEEATAAIEDSIVDPYAIVFDANSEGQINDGGGDMYDGGNRIMTSLCGDENLAPYTDDMEAVASDCFGTGGETGWTSAHP